MGILSDVEWDKVETGGALLPEAIYNLTVLKAEEKTNEEKGNTWASLFCKVSDGEFEGKTVNVNLYVVCASAKTLEKRKIAEDIAKSQIKILFTNNGLEKIDTVADLVGLTSQAKIKIQKSEQYDDSNQVSFLKKKVEANTLPF